jgi:hypothetical protein
VELKVEFRESTDFLNRLSNSIELKKSLSSLFKLSEVFGRIGTSVKTANPNSPTLSTPIC